MIRGGTTLERKGAEETYLVGPGISAPSLRYARKTIDTGTVRRWLAEYCPRSARGCSSAALESGLRARVPTVSGCLSAPNIKPPCR